MTDKPAKKPRRFGCLVKMGWAALIFIAALFAVRIVWGLVAQHRIDLRVERLRAAGEPTTPTELAKLLPAPPPDNENAAVLYESAARTVRALPMETRRRVPWLADKIARWDEMETEEARAIVGQVSEALSIMAEATHRKGAAYAVDPNDLVRVDMVFPPTTKLVLELEVYLGLSARNHAEAGRVSEVMDVCRSMLRLARSANGIPSELGTVEAAEAQTFRTMRDLLDRAEVPEESLRAFLRDIPETDSREPLLAALKCSRVRVLVGFRILLDKAGFFGQLRNDELGAYFYLFRPSVCGEAVRNLDELDRCEELARKPWWETTEERRAMEKRLEPRSALKGFLPSISPAATDIKYLPRAFERTSARERATQIAILLRLYRMKHENYPDSLDALVPEFIENPPVDPFTGKAFLYRRQGSGFILYSVGPNGIDDGGKAEPVSQSGDDIAVSISR